MSAKASSDTTRGPPDAGDIQDAGERMRDRGRYEDPSDQMHFTGRNSQFVAECWVDGPDQGVSALAGTHASEIAESMLGDDVLRVDPSVRSWALQFGYETRRPSVCGSRRGDDKRETTARVAGASDKIELSSSGAILMCREKFRIYLAGQINLDRRIGGDDIVILAENARVVDVVRHAAFNRRVVIDYVVGDCRAHRDVRHALATIGRLATVGDGTSGDQAGDAVASSVMIDPSPSAVPTSITQPEAFSLQRTLVSTSASSRHAS